jgi:hypothetical protein
MFKGSASCIQYTIRERDHERSSSFPGGGGTGVRCGGNNESPKLAGGVGGCTYLAVGIARVVS